MTDLTGRKLGKYVLEERLGAGGMAAVFRSHHPQFDKPVAVKILPPAVSQDAGFRARFEREGRTIAALNHPNIIRVYDVDEADGLFYMVMDLLPGGTLEGRIREAQLDRRWSVETIIKVADALEYAHSRGIIHRDIKPSNILLDSENQPVLADFGIARLLDPGEAQLTATGTVMGTLAYMSPEQLNGQPSDGRADVYSLGIVLYQLLVGRVPFTGDTMSVISGHLTKEPPPLHEFAPDIPQAMEEVVLQTLAKNPDHRFRSARAFAQALRNTLAELEPGMVHVASAARAQTPPTFGGVHLPTATRAPAPAVGSTLPSLGQPEAVMDYVRRHWPYVVGVIVLLLVIGPIARMRVGDLVGLIILVVGAWFAYTYWRAQNARRSPPTSTMPPPVETQVNPAITAQLTEDAGAPALAATDIRPPQEQATVVDAVRLTPEPPVSADLTPPPGVDASAATMAAEIPQVVERAEAPAAASAGASDEPMPPVADAPGDVQDADRSSAG